MSKRTIILIVILLGVTALLLAVALTPKKKPPVTVNTPEQNLAYAQTTLKINTPAPSSSSNGLYTANVEISTGQNKVNGVQLEISFDTTHVTDFEIVPGSFLAKSTELIKIVNNKSGTASYALGVPPGTSGVMGKGTVAVITFREIGTAGQYARIDLEPKTKVSSQETDRSVLKTAVSTTFKIGEDQSPLAPSTQSGSSSTKP